MLWPELNDERLFPLEQVPSENVPRVTLRKDAAACWLRICCWVNVAVGCGPAVFVGAGVEVGCVVPVGTVVSCAVGWGLPPNAMPKREALSARPINSARMTTAAIRTASRERGLRGCGWSA